MKIIDLETGLSLNEMAGIYFELEEKNADIMDLIRKKENVLGVITKKDKNGFYLGILNDEKGILVTEFNAGTFAQYYITKKSSEYNNVKKIIEESYKEAIV